MKKLSKTKKSVAIFVWVWTVYVISVHLSSPKADLKVVETDSNQFRIYFASLLTHHFVFYMNKEFFQDDLFISNTNFLRRHTVPKKRSKEQKPNEEEHCCEDEEEEEESGKGKNFQYSRRRKKKFFLRKKRTHVHA